MCVLLAIYLLLTSTGLDVENGTDVAQVLMVERSPSYNYLPKTIKEQINQFDLPTIMKALEDPKNDTLFCFVLGQVGEKALKGLPISQFHTSFVSLPRLLFERATAGDSEGS